MGQKVENYKSVIIIILALLLIAISYKTCTAEPEIIEVTKTIPEYVEVHDTITIDRTDTLYLTRTRVDTTRIVQWRDLDSVQRDSAYIEDTAERTYNVRSEDSLSIVDAEIVTDGYLKSTQFTVTHKERDIKFDVEVPKRPIQFGLGVEVGVPLQAIPNIYNNPQVDDINRAVFKINGVMVTDKSIWSLGLDTQKRVWLGYTHKF